LGWQDTRLFPEGVNNDLSLDLLGRALGFVHLFFVVVPLVMFVDFALADLFRRSGMSAVSRVIWLLVIIWLPILGAIVYLLTRPAAETVQY
jgi:Phospholipase_D-nuclease N-terminal